MWMRLRHTLIVSGLVLGLSSCTLLPGGSSSSYNTYLLEAPDASISPAKTPSQRVLQVPLPRAEPGFDSVGIAYRRDGVALQYYTRSQWADTPARLLTPLVVRALERSGTFRAVLGPQTGGRADWRLELELLRLQQVFTSDNRSHSEVQLRVQLIDLVDRSVLLSQVLSAQAPAPSADAQGAVQAANVALGQIMRQLEQLLVAQISSD